MCMLGVMGNQKDGCCGGVVAGKGGCCGTPPATTRPNHKKTAVLLTKRVVAGGGSDPTRAFHYRAKGPGDTRRNDPTRAFHLVIVVESYSFLRIIAVAVDEL